MIKKKKIIIDSRIRKAEYEYLSEYFDILKLPLSEDVYQQISGHSDVFYCKIDDKIICAPNSPIIIKKFIKGYSKIQNEYPKDVAYNVCQIGNNLIASKYVDNKILEEWQKEKMLNKNRQVITVNQGYVKCSISVTGENSCITSDESIYKKLKQYEIETKYIKEDNIHLLDRNSNITSMKGFIGGASFQFDNKFVIFGDINKLNADSEKTIKNEIERNGLQLVDFKNLDVIDYGGALII